MKAERIEVLLRSLQADRISSVPYGGGEKVRSCCPLAIWLHKSGKDSHPSFAVFSSEDESWCRCFACGFKGTLRDLVWKLQGLSGGDFSAVHLFITDNDQREVEGKAHLKKRKPSDFLYTPANAVTTAASDIGGAFDPVKEGDNAKSIQEHEHCVLEMVALLDAEAMEYLHGEKRGLDDAAIRKWKIGWHPGARRVSVPQYDRTQRLVNIGGRYVPTLFERMTPPEQRGWEPPSWMHGRGFKKDLYLFGEDKFVTDGSCRTGFLVEGMFDVVSLDSKGLPNVGAMCGSYLSYVQTCKILAWFDRLVIIPDGDKAGRDAAARISGALGPRMSHGVFVFDIPDGKDPDQLEPEIVQQIRHTYIG